MKRTLYTAILMALCGLGTAAASERCNVQMSNWQPREALQVKLETMRALACGLMRSSPERPGDDSGGVDASLGQFCGSMRGFR